jgi:hypothetical protein
LAPLRVDKPLVGRIGRSRLRREAKARADRTAWIGEGARVEPEVVVRCWWVQVVKRH